MNKLKEILRALLAAGIVIACILSFWWMLCIAAVIALYALVRWMLSEDPV